MHLVLPLSSLLIFSAIRIMKRSTLILFLLAAALGTAVYYLEYKPGKPRDEGEVTSASKPAWEIKSEDITSVEISRPGEKIRLNADGEKWMLVEPLRDRAGESNLRSLLGDLSGMTIMREFTPANSDDLKNYGLVAPALRIEMKLKSGQTRVIEIGEKDVIGTAVYARIDGGSSIAMVSPTILTSAGRKVNEFRDLTLLGGTSTDLAGLGFVSASGRFELTRLEDTWSFSSPIPGDTEDSEVTGLVSSLTTAEAIDIISETPTEAVKYGLAAPKLTLTARLSNGGQRVISIGNKVDEDYYASVSDRPQIYRVNASFRDRVATSAATLRSKSLFRFNREQIKSVQIRNANLTVVAERNSEGKWLIVTPDDLKGLEASTFFVLDPFETRASEIIEKPDSKIVAALSKPMVEAKIIDDAGKVTVVKFSVPSNNSAYAKVEGRPDVLKVPDSLVNNLGFKRDQVVLAQPGSTP